MQKETWTEEVKKFIELAEASWNPDNFSDLMELINLQYPMEKETWEEKLELQFGDMLNMVEVQTGVSERQPIKDFINSLLSSQKEKMRWVLEGMEIDCQPLTGMTYVKSKGYNLVLSDIKKKIEEEL